MKRALFVLTLALFPFSTAHADIKSTNLGIPVKLVQGNGTSVCQVFGSWLDITDRVSVSGTGVTVSKNSTGGGPGNPWVRINITVSATATPGDRTITLSRPAIGGRDSDTLPLTVLKK